MLWGTTIACLSRASVWTAAFVGGSARQPHTTLVPLTTTTTNTPYRTIASSSSTSLFAMRYLLKYNYVPDVLEKRGPYRQQHLDLAKDLIAQDRCLSGGPTGKVEGDDIPTGALFVFTDLDAAKLFVQQDPYVSNGIVTGHEIEEWNVVVEKEQ